MNQAQEVETQRRSQATKQHAAELQTVSVSLVMRHQVIVVKEPYSEYGGVHAHTQEEDTDKAHHLNKNVVVMLFSFLDEDSKQREDRVRAEEGTLRPDHGYREDRKERCQQPAERLPEHTLPVPLYSRGVDELADPAGAV